MGSGITREPAAQPWPSVQPSTSIAQGHQVRAGCSIALPGARAMEHPARPKAGLSGLAYRISIPIIQLFSSKSKFMSGPPE